jgi:hypothetical protein
MARLSSFSVTVDTIAVEEVAQSLGRIDGAALGRAAMTAVNTVAEQAFNDARKKMNEGINLTDAYLQANMSFTPATDTVKPTAVVTARREHSTLTRYGAQQLTKPVRFPNGSFTSGTMGKNPRKAGAMLPWKLRTGDESRGIPVNMKQAGLSVEVTRGSRKPISYAFVIRGRNGNLLTAKRVPGTRRKIEVLYGPSVYQLFRAALDTTFLADVADRLSKTVVTLTADELKKAME